MGNLGVSDSGGWSTKDFLGNGVFSNQRTDFEALASSRALKSVRESSLRPQHLMSPEYPKCPK